MSMIRAFRPVLATRLPRASIPTIPTIWFRSKGTKARKGKQHGGRKQTPTGPEWRVLTDLPRSIAREPPPKAGKKAVHVYSDVTGDYITVSPMWLRDNCPCSTCVHQDTRQRLLDTFNIPKQLKVSASKETKDGIEVRFSDGHESFYTYKFLLEAGLHASRGVRRQGLVKTTLWDSSIKDNPPTVTYEAASKTEEGLKDWLTKIREYGFCYVSDTPPTPEATEKLLERIAFIRNTHYGGFYDFTADLASKDTAYTSIALEAHTDNTYFSDPAGLQAFHLLSHTEGSGGASLLVDGFKAAADLLERDPIAYRILTRINVHGHASGNDGISIQPYRGFPVLQHHPVMGQLVQVRWNSSDRAAIDMPLHEVDRWYKAARKWDRMMKSEEYQYWEQLTPGRVLVFDNWRVLHGRSHFTGKRRICGAYINRDDWISKFKILHYGQKEVLNSLVVG